MGLKISNLIASEIIRNEDINARVSAIEKWVAVADICRCLHNYNAVLEITSSMNRSAIFRLKKTWLKVSKQVRVGSWHHYLPGAGLGWAEILEYWPLDIPKWAEDRVRANIPSKTPSPISPGTSIGPTNVALGPTGLKFPLE